MTMTADDIRQLVVDSSSFDSEDIRCELIAQMVETCLKMAGEGHDSGQVKLVAHALKEMRYAYRVFNRYRGVRKATIYGSARTPEGHADYEAARRFSELIAEQGWMAITGAGDGIMKAGHEGPKREASFGLAIRLPFETTANAIIEGDPKLINFRYFFTRKLMFMTHADAVAVFPGGFGTQDELFEALTLVQTGKSNILPVVLCAGEGNDYWSNWAAHVSEDLLRREMISEEDLSFFHVAKSPADAADHIAQFYRVYHSSRYVRSDFVIRMNFSINDASVQALNSQFDDIIREGCIQQTGPLPGESDHLELPRLVVPHTRRSYGRLRQLIDALNMCEPA